MGNLCDRLPQQDDKMIKNTKKQSFSWRNSAQSAMNSFSRCSCSLSSHDPTAVIVSALARRCRRGGTCDNTVLLSRSSSHTVTGSKKKLLDRSSSSRRRSLTDPLLTSHRLLHQLDSFKKDEIKVEDQESSHFLLVHGGGYGAWCWYKTIALLEQGGFKVTVVDLTASGIHSLDPNKVENLVHYVHPLFQLLQDLPHGERVILVGHDLGGTCVSYAMESFPHKISKAVFVAATMPTDGQTTLDILSGQVEPNSRMLVYANGDEHPPTSISLDKTLFGDLYFNRTPSKDVALAGVSIRPIPFMPITERVSLTDENYGSVRQFYVRTMYDKAITREIQEKMIRNNPPEKVFYLKGSDHSPFFSKPQALNKVLLEVAHLPYPS